jgi:hypothetical protein
MSRTEFRLVRSSSSRTSGLGLAHFRSAFRDRARTVDGADPAEIKDHFAALLEDFTYQARKGGGLVSIDDAALAVNDHHITAIASFQTEFQLGLLIWCCESSQVLRLRR